MATTNGVATEPVPPLRDGDRLTRAEYWRRYEASPAGTRAELLRGMVYLNRWVETKCDGTEYLMPPTSAEGHAAPQFSLSTWLGVYQTYTTGVAGATPTSLHLPDATSNPEPDSLLRILPAFGGATTTDDRGYIHGPPELLVEVSNTSATTDLGEKLEVYQVNGVREYIVWRTRANSLDWFVLRRRRYVPIEPDPADGLLKSVVFPGLWLDAAALLRRDGRTVLAALQRGLASPEHAEFEAQLAATAARLAKPKAKKKRK
jgi:Uma2 family endonuclease